jgi:hypothetical protein
MDSMPALIALFELFGISHGFLRTYDRTDYKIDDSTTLTIKLNGLMGDHFELERLASSSSDAGILSLETILAAVPLKAWTREELAVVIKNDHEAAASKNICAELASLGVINIPSSGRGKVAEGQACIGE